MYSICTVKQKEYAPTTDGVSPRPLLTNLERCRVPSSSKYIRYRKALFSELSVFKVNRKSRCKSRSSLHGPKLCDYLYSQSKVCELCCIFQFTGRCERLISCLGQTDPHKLTALENRASTYLEPGRAEWRFWDAQESRNCKSGSAVGVSGNTHVYTSHST